MVVHETKKRRGNAVNTRSVAKERGRDQRGDVAICNSRKRVPGEANVSRISYTYASRSTMQGDTAEARSRLVYTALYTSQQARGRVGLCATCTRAMGEQGITFGGSILREGGVVDSSNHRYSRLDRRAYCTLIPRLQRKSAARVEPSTSGPKPLL